MVVDWCEQNYHYLSNVAEFYNAASSLCIALAGVVGWYKHDRAANVLLISIGLTSVYYHTTLTAVGQYLDELSIILLVEYCAYSYLNLHGRWLTGFITACTSVNALLWLYPPLNAVLMLGIGLIVIRWLRQQHLADEHLHTSIAWLLAALVMWIWDKFCYNNWHTHWLWHMLVSVHAYYGVKFVDRVKRQRANKLVDIVID